MSEEQTERLVLALEKIALSLDFIVDRLEKEEKEEDGKTTPSTGGGGQSVHHI